MTSLHQQHSKMIIGLTGGIGSGKTAVSDLLGQKGIDVVDADVVARQVVEPGSKALQQISDTFGTEFLLTDGNLNRAKLRETIFSDVEAKTKLNQIMQPAIRNELLLQLKSATSCYVILSAPLLLENKLEGYCDRVLVVDVDEATQVQRATKRDSVDIEQIKAIIASQIDRKSRLAKATDIIDNSGTLAELQKQVDEIHQKYLTLAGA